MKNQLKKLLPYIGILGLIMFLFGNSTISTKAEPDIVKMTGLLQQEKSMHIEDWSVYARERMKGIATESEFNHEVEKLKKISPDFQWKKEGDKQSWKASATFEHVENGLVESINLMTTHGKTNQVTYIIYEVKGSVWKKDYASFLKTPFQKRIHDIFRGNPSIFSCVKGHFSDTIDKVLPLEITRLLDLFQAKEIEHVKEQNFISVTGHTNVFEQSLTSEHMNLQLALRTEGLGGKTSFTVGTPIITFEY
ncbi:TATA-box binding [Bacillus sp. OV322]|uniref:YwmB family TATA-box binding protein n=1 Tax=Bacillus sp. OV322 TaxID=1882764 RepID=UPI0008F434D4|nr:YwmB family TATA-box binding protein [Bacillus sp. OV322]SFC22219.1 TATA-box binding [Bacillus sp. OV322]